MSKSINFVSDRRKNLTKSQKQDKKIMGIMINVLIGVFVVFLVVLILRFTYIFKVKTVADEQKNIKNVILSNEDIEKEYVIFAQKLKKLSVFFGKRKDKQEALTFFSNIFGEDVIVSGIDYSSADKDTVSFTIKTPSIFVMERVFAVLKTTDVTSNYPNITKSNMRRSASGNYTLNLTIMLVSAQDLSKTNTDQANLEGDK